MMFLSEYQLPSLELFISRECFKNSLGFTGSVKRSLTSLIRKAWGGLLWGPSWLNVSENVQILTTCIETGRADSASSSPQCLGVMFMFILTEMFWVRPFYTRSAPSSPPGRWGLLPWNRYFWHLVDLSIFWQTQLAMRSLRPEHFFHIRSGPPYLWPYSNCCQVCSVLLEPCFRRHSMTRPSSWF